MGYSYHCGLGWTGCHHGCSFNSLCSFLFLLSWLLCIRSSSARPVHLQRALELRARAEEALAVPEILWVMQLAQHLAQEPSSDLVSEGGGDRLLKQCFSTKKCIPH